MTNELKRNNFLGAFAARFGKNRFGIYTVLFLVTGFFVFLPYFINGRSLICSGDAVHQHYPALAYYGEYLRDFLGTLWNEHRFSLPSWDISLGYGGDIVTTLHYYCLGDPLSLISVFFPPKYTELCFGLLIVLRLYLSGISMLWYCKHRNTSVCSSVLGALIYSFSGYAVSVGVFHPFFTIPMIYLPLLLLGVDLIYEGRSPALFIASVALSLLSNFYFFYMLVIFTVLYAVLRYFTYIGRPKLLSVLRMFSRFLGSALIGVLLAMPVFLPNILSLLQSDRISVARQIPLFYPLDYYASLPAATVSEYGQYYVYITISAVAVFAVLVLLSLPLRRNIPLISALLLLFAFLLFPKVGSAFNGFNYVTNRWIWALTFALGYVTAVMLPKSETLTRKQLRRLALLTVLFCLLCLLPNSSRNLQTYIALTALIVCVCSAAFASRFEDKRKTVRAVIATLTVLTLVFNGYYHVSPRYENWAGNSEKLGSAYERYYDSAVSVIDALPNADTGRFDSASNSLDFNTAIVHDTGGTSFYFSTVNPGTSLFQRSQMLNSSMDQQYKGLDGRSYLAAALSVAYYVSDGKETTARPYGYDVEVADNIYTSEHTLPLVYVFDSVYDGGEDLSVTERQQALLQCAMTDEAYPLPQARPEFTHRELSFEVASENGARITGNRITAEKTDATLTLTFDEVTDSELYLIAEDLDFSAADDVTETGIWVYDGTVQQALRYKTAADNFSSGRHSFLVNLGYSENARSSLTLSFRHAGEFEFSSLSIVAQPLGALSEQIDALADSGVSGIDVDKDTIRFASDRDAAGMACVSIPYQKGWTARVDGEKTEIVCIQDGLCGIYLDAGSHEVVLSYQTPNTLLSWVMFAAGALSFAGLLIYRKRAK